jgi:hypothetical protein
MKKLKVISPKNLPARPPLTFSTVVVLTLDRLHAAGYLWGAAIAVLVLIWAAFFVGLYSCEHVEIFKKTSG